MKHRQFSSDLWPHYSASPPPRPATSAFGHTCPKYPDFHHHADIFIVKPSLSPPHRHRRHHQTSSSKRHHHNHMDVTITSNLSPSPSHWHLHHQAATFTITLSSLSPSWFYHHYHGRKEGGGPGSTLQATSCHGGCVGAVDPRFDRSHVCFFPSSVKRWNCLPSCVSPTPPAAVPVRGKSVIT